MVRKRRHSEGVNLSLHFPILSPFSHFPILSTFAFQFLVRSLFPLHFLASSPFSRRPPAASCATLFGVVFQVSEWKLCSQQIRIGLCHLCAMFLCFCALSADKRGKYFSGHRLTFDPLRSGAGVLTRGLDDLSCPGVPAFKTTQQ